MLPFKRVKCMPKLNWDELCVRCIYSSSEKRVASSKGRCTHKCPSIIRSDIGWECNSFVRRWDTKEDLEKARQEKQA